MNELEFMDLARTLFSLYRVPHKKEDRDYCAGKYSKCSRKTEATLEAKDAFLYCDWSGGGISGGSCWDTGEQDHHSHTEGEPEPEFEDLDNFLIEICPKMGFLQYKKLLQNLERDSYSVNEYYGNSSTTCYKVMNLHKLYEALVEMDLV